MTLDFIAYHAAERPGAVALINEGREITYADFARAIPKFTRALRAFGLPRGARVAIGCEDTYFHWLLRIGCEQLGLVVASMPASATPASWPFLEDFDLILSGEDLSAGGVRRSHLATPSWLETILAGADVSGEPAAWAESPEDPMRMGYTSGTTGTPKRLLFSRRNHENSIVKAMWFNGFTRRSRNLLAMPLSVAGGYTNATACVRSGGTVVVESRLALEQAITSHGITHTTLAPISVQNLLDVLSSGFRKPDDFTIFTWGAAISTVLRAKVLARLATDLCDIYGSNEASATSFIRGTAEFGCVLPRVQVEVVDDEGQVLPFGKMGEIRVRTDCMVDGYLDDPETTRLRFRDGWFYAGDLGILHDTRRLQVIGRSDDLLNIGWRKFAPTTLEELVLHAIGAGDVGVCSLPNADGIEEVCVVVSNARCADQELMERIAEAFRRLQLGRYHVIKTDRVPRNATGKIERDALKRSAADWIRDRR
jgi:acyl-CoA synthetase (AMP-forming)/AMP-acid ligase II